VSSFGLRATRCATSLRAAELCLLSSWPVRTFTTVRRAPMRTPKLHVETIRAATRGPDGLFKRDRWTLQSFCCFPFAACLQAERCYHRR
jgi:hypothetical protein